MGVDTDLIDRDGGDKDNTVLDRTCSDYKDKSVLNGTSGDDETLVQEGTSDREGSLVGRVGSSTSISQSISPSSSSSTTNIPNGRLTHLVSRDLRLLFWNE